MINMQRYKVLLWAGTAVLIVALLIELLNLPQAKIWLDSVGGSSRTLLVLLAICLGTIWIDRLIVSSDRVFTQANARYRIMLRAALVLSAVSFGTTAFGMLEFVEGSQTSTGDGFTGTFISMGTTFGIQIIMLFIALELGERLLKLRPRFDDDLHKIHGEYGSDSISRARRMQMRAGWLIALALGVMALFAWDVISPADFASLLVFSNSSARIWLGVICVLGALWALLAFGVVRNIFAFITLVFLGLVYAGTLAVSSLFSFDSYYSILQSKEDIEQRRGSILREETEAMRRMSYTSLRTQLEQLQQAPESEAIHEEVKGGLNTLLSKSREFETQLAADSVKARALQEADNKRIAEQVERLEAERDDEIQEELSIIVDRRALEEQVTLLDSQRQAAQQVLTKATADRDAVQSEINTRLTLADCEEFGIAEGADCQGTTGRVSCGPNCQRYRQEAANLGRIQLPQAERRVVDARVQLETIISQFEEAQVRLDATNFEATASEGGISPAAERANQIRARYNKQIKELRDQITYVSPKDSNGETFDIEGLSRNYDIFRSAPGAETLKEYTRECRQIKDGLTRIGVLDAEVATFDCQPASMRIFAANSDRLRDALKDYETTCSTTPSDPSQGAPVQSSGSNDESTLRKLIDFTRSCLSIANFGQEDVRAMSRDLTELESSYLTGRADLRSSINDLIRGNQFAIGAASAAVFVDVLILVVGLLMAMNSPSMLFENPLDPVPTKVEDLILNIAETYSSDGSTASSFQIFLSYVEDRAIPVTSARNPEALLEEIYRATINENSIAASHRSVVKALKNGIPARYKREMSFVSPRAPAGTKPETRTAINQTIIAFMNQHAYVQGTAAVATTSDDEIGQTRTEFYSSLQDYRRSRAENEALNLENRRTAAEKGTAPKPPKDDL